MQSHIWSAPTESVQAMTPPRFAAGSLRSKKDKTIEYMECINYVDASSDVVTALQKRIKAEVKYSLQSRAL